MFSPRKRSTIESTLACKAPWLATSVEMSRKRIPGWPPPTHKGRYNQYVYRHGATSVLAPFCGGWAIDEPSSVIIAYRARESQARHAAILVGVGELFSAARSCSLFLSSLTPSHSPHSLTGRETEALTRRVSWLFTRVEPCVREVREQQQEQGVPWVTHLNPSHQVVCTYAPSSDACRFVCARSLAARTPRHESPANHLVFLLLYNVCCCHL